VSGANLFQTEQMQRIIRAIATDYPHLPMESVRAAVMAATSAVGDRDDLDIMLAAVEGAARADLSLLSHEVAPGQRSGDGITA
jgi:hypothetical protein